MLGKTIFYISKITVDVIFVHNYINWFVSSKINYTCLLGFIYNIPSWVYTQVVKSIKAWSRSSILWYQSYYQKVYFHSLSPWLPLSLSLVITSNQFINKTLFITISFSEYSFQFFHLIKIWFPFMNMLHAVLEISTWRCYINLIGTCLLLLVILSYLYFWRVFLYYFVFTTQI